MGHQYLLVEVLLDHEGTLIDLPKSFFLNTPTSTLNWENACYPAHHTKQYGEHTEHLSAEAPNFALLYRSIPNSLKRMKGSQYGCREYHDRSTSALRSSKTAQIPFLNSPRGGLGLRPEFHTSCNQRMHYQAGSACGLIGA